MAVPNARPWSNRCLISAPPFVLFIEDKSCAVGKRSTRQHATEHASDPFDRCSAVDQEADRFRQREEQQQRKNQRENNAEIAIHTLAACAKPKSRRPRRPTEIQPTIWQRAWRAIA